MTVAKVTSASYGSLGRSGTRQDNELTAITGVILTTPDFKNSIANLALEATWIAGIKAGQVFPLNGLDSYEDQSSEDTIYESPAKRRKLLLRGKKRYMFQLDAPYEVHRKLHTYFNNADLKVWLVRDDKLQFTEYLDGATPSGEGFATSMINIGSMKEVPADGSTPAFTPVYLDLDDYLEMDKFGQTIEPTWSISGLEPLHDVTLEQVSASATSIVIKVYTKDGYDTDGSVKEVAIKGIACTVGGAIDLTYTKVPAGSGVLTTVTDNSDGTYTFAGTGFADDDVIALKTPQNMVSDGLFIKALNTVTVAVP